MATATLQVRLDASVKSRAKAVLADLGMNLSEAVNVFLRQVVLHDGLPFDVVRQRPNAASREALAQADALERSAQPAQTADEFIAKLHRLSGLPE
jgi:DNA-damage-inducible protein J